MGKVDFGGVYKRVCLEHTPDAEIGQFVIVHVGFALQVINEQEARTVFEFLERMNELDELREEEPETSRWSPAPSNRPNPQSAIRNSYEIPTRIPRSGRRPEAA
jgi:hydrogenase expression/formation protein HypC